MPSFCSMFGCSNRAERDRVRFFRIPAASRDRGNRLDELSKKRRSMWIGCLKRGDLTETFLKNARICSEHFVNGSPAELEDTNNPDWIPSENLGYTSTKSQKERARKRHARSVQQSEEKSKRLRTIINTDDIATARTCNENVPQDISASEIHENSVSFAVQTDLTMEKLSDFFMNREFCSSQIGSLKSKLQQVELTEASFEGDDEKTTYFTGLFNSASVLYLSIAPDLSTKKALSPFQQLLLTLMKLRLNLPFKYLAYRFSISPTTASETFFATVHVLHTKFRNLIFWPDRNQLKKNVPSCFLDTFGDRVSVIIDCFEVFTETPSNDINASQCCSIYKHHETVKFLIAISPQGTISYISEAWGGRTSDKHLTENCGVLNLISPDDVILADRGFLIEDSVKISGAESKISAFRKGKTQLHPLDMEKSQSIASVRIHVERLKGLLKNKFKILQQTVPVSTLSNIDVLDEIMVVCCAIINMCNSLVPLSK